MANNIKSKLEDLHTELACTVDTLDIVSKVMAESTGQQQEKDSIYSIVLHLTRVVEDMDNEIQKL